MPSSSVAHDPVRASSQRCKWFGPEEVIMALRSIVLLSALVLALSGTSMATAGRSTKPPRTIDVTAKDYAFSLSAHSVGHGPVRFVIRNAGHTTHDFAIAGTARGRSLRARRQL